MKKILILTYILLLSAESFAQGGGIGTINADASAILELSSTTQGLLIPRMTTGQRDAINSPAIGLIIFNIDTDCLNIYASTSVWSVMCDTSITPFILDCANAVITSTLTEGVSASGVSAAIPYTGGDGSAHTGQVVTSTGVTGLTATLTAGNFATGAGSLTYIITGTPASAGTANFAINIGGQACTLAITVADTGIPGNTLCIGATISATNCTPGELSTGINGGSHGNKYNNTIGGTYSVVNIGDQCWMDENIDVNPAGSPAWVNAIDTGWYGYYNNSYQAVDEGTMLQWSVAMNGSTTERAQGVCPTGWHVPSDCELMYLENTLGMSVAQQELIGWRGTNQGTQLRVGGTSGYNGIFAGYRSTNGGFGDRGLIANYWSSSESGGNAYSRILTHSNTAVYREVLNKVYAWGVRCLKD